MPVNYKILGQVAPSATTETDLYTVPTATETIISSIVICNRSSSSATFRLSISADGAATATKDYQAYDTTIAGNGIQIMTVGFTINAADKVRVYASSANLSFSAYGSEIS